MKVVTAVEPLGGIRADSVFLAGGITNCPWWQDEIIELLKPHEGTILNPRRKNFPIDDPNAANEQIVWEFEALERAKVFSMWFSASESVQPICMYELGRHLALRAKYNPQPVRTDAPDVVIGVEPGYLRAEDVYIQVGLVSATLADRITTNLEDHAKAIVTAMGKQF